MLDFPKKRDKSSGLLRHTQRQVSFQYADRFAVIHVKCRVRLYLVFGFPKGQYESKYELKTDSMKIAEKHNPNRGIYYDVKSTFNVSVSVTIIRTWISK